METAVALDLGESLRILLARWRQEYPKRARGGWWALAGFSFQVSQFLLRFFQQIGSGTSEPGQVAKMEGLSDILAPSGSKLVLTQAKRTLTREHLAEAVREAYLITGLCLRWTPGLLDYLRFQVACRHIKTPLPLQNLDPAEVIGKSVDEACWSVTLGLFDAEAPVIEEDDPLDQLYVQLWNEGIVDPTQLIDRCGGCLLSHFEESAPDGTRNVGRELNSLFQDAPRHVAWRPVGTVLTERDVAPDPIPGDTQVLVDTWPHPEHLRRCHVRERPRFFDRLWRAFAEWREGLGERASASGRVPVFWIAGRSGEGKSVLVLQLLQRLLMSGSHGPVLLLDSAADVVYLLAQAPGQKGAAGSGVSQSILAAVDDLYAVRDRRGWASDVRAALGRRAWWPAAAVLTCGPSDQLGQFCSQAGHQLDVARFDVPPLDDVERREFEDWYRQRTGTATNYGRLVTDDVPLAQFMFELARGERMPAFAHRFRTRLEQYPGLFEAVRAVLAVNALDLGAPLGLVPPGAARDGLEQLCAEDQPHFAIVASNYAPAEQCVYLRHPHLPWVLFVEWVDNPPGLAKTWARELAKSLALWCGQQHRPSANRLLRSLLVSTHLSGNRGGPQDAVTADALAVMQRLYEEHVGDEGCRPSPETLPRWLECMCTLRGLNLVPDPVEYAETVLRDNCLASLVDRDDVELWLRRIREARATGDTIPARIAAADFLTLSPVRAEGRARSRSDAVPER